VDLEIFAIGTCPLDWSYLGPEHMFPIL